MTVRFPFHPNLFPLGTFIYLLLSPFYSSTNPQIYMLLPFASVTSLPKRDVVIFLRRTFSQFIPHVLFLFSSMSPTCRQPSFIFILACFYLHCFWCCWFLFFVSFSLSFFFVLFLSFFQTLFIFLFFFF